MNPTDLEQLSRLEAGELSPEAARALEERMAVDPELAAARERLRALGPALHALEDPPFPDGAADRWAKAAVAALPKNRKPAGEWKTRVGAAALVAAAAAAVFMFWPSSQQGRIDAVEGSVAVFTPKEALRGSAGLKFGLPATVLTSSSASASVVLGADEGRLGASSEVALGSGPQLAATLQTGEITAKTAGGQVSVGPANVRIEGEARVWLEPFPAAVRETGAQEGVPMNPKTIAAVAVSAAAFTVYVVSGHAEVTPEPGATPVRIAAGATWKSPRPAAPSLPSQALEAPKESVGSGAVASAALKARPSDDPATWSKDALVDEVRSLRAQLKDTQEKLASRAAESARGRRAWQQDAQTLRALAADGTLELRVPQYMPHASLEAKVKVSDAVKRDLNLSDEEAAKIEAIYGDSQKRINEKLRALLSEAGESKDSIDAMAYGDLYEQLQRRGAEGDGNRAIREVANERAGLVPVRSDAESTVVERGVRLMATEDQKTLDEIDALLGSARSKALHEHKNFPRSIFSSHVGPSDSKDK